MPIEDDLALLSELGLGPDAPLLRDPRILVDSRLLSAVHAQLARELGVEDAYLRLYQVGLLHGLQDAARVDAACAGPPPAGAESGVVACLPLAIALGRAPFPVGPDAALAMTGAWPEAVEAAAWLSAVGISATPVCGVSAGYTAGWLSGMHERDFVVVETRCAARGDVACEFVVREPEAWAVEGDPVARRLAERAPLAEFREVSRGPALPSPAPPATPRPALVEPASFEPGATVVDVWGPVMVLPFTDPDDVLRLVEVVRSDPGTREVTVVVIDLGGRTVDEGFGAAALERAVEILEEWGAEIVLTGVSELADPVVTELEERHLVIRKDTPDAIAAAFQIAQAQRHAV